MDVQAVLSRLVKTARNTFFISEHMRTLGYDDNPYFSIYGNIVDVICEIIGDASDDVEDSVTYAVLHDTNLSDDQCVSRLRDVCQIHHPQLSKTTMNLVREAASARGVSARTMQNVIVGEWALRQSVIKKHLAV